MILIAPWWPSQPWFPHLLRLSVDHPRFFQYRRDLLSQQGYISSGKSYHLHTWRLSCSTTKQHACFSKEVSWRSELKALVFDPQYIQFKPKGAEVTLYFTPEFMRKNQRPNQVNDSWYIPAVLTGRPEFGAPSKLPSEGAQVLSQIYV